MAFFGPADGVAAVAAGVEQDLGAAFFVADDDDAVFADVGLEEVARVGDLGLVGHEVPGAGKDLLQLELVDLLVREDPAPVSKAQRGGRFTLLLGDNDQHERRLELDRRHLDERPDRLRPGRSRHGRTSAATSSRRWRASSSPDPTTVVLKLKPGMTYHDIPPVSVSRAVKSDDIAASQAYITALPNAFDSTFQQGSPGQAETPDDRTAVYRLKKPQRLPVQPDLPRFRGTSQPIIPKETLDKLDGARQIGSGPYHLDTFDFRNNYLYKRFDKFRDAGKNLPSTWTSGRSRSSSTRWRRRHRSWAARPPGSAAQHRVRSTASRRTWATKPISPSARPAEFLLAPQYGRRATHGRRTSASGEAFWRLTDRKQVLDLAYLGARA